MAKDLPIIRRMAGALFGGSGVSYLLRDDFTTDVAAGSVNGSAAVPGPGTRKAIDTGSKISVATRKLTFAGAKAVPAWGDPAFWHRDAITRTPGTIVPMQTKFTVGTPYVKFGLCVDTSTQPIAATSNTIFLNGNGTMLIVDANSSGGSIVGVLATATDYTHFFVLRATGVFYFLKSASGTALQWITNAGNTNPLYPEIWTYALTGTFDFIRVPQTLWLPTPLLSDGFGGTWPTSDGAGHAETSGLGSGGGSMTWVASVGTWGISSAKAACSALDGGIGIATVSLSTTNVVHTAALTRAGDNVGVVVRYTDAANHIYAYHDGTNAVLVKKITGSDTTKITGVATYSAGADIRVIVDGTYLALYYNNALVGSVTDAVIPTGAGVGIYTSNTGNAIDNVRTYARGTEGQYVTLDRYAA